MKVANRFISAFWKDESGISSVEYALLLAFVAAGIVAAAAGLGAAVQGEMVQATTCISVAPGAVIPPGC